MIPETDHPIATRFEILRSRIVIDLLIEMLAAVNFDDKLFLIAYKVCYVFPDGMLPTKFMIVQQSITQVTPKMSFRVRLRLAQIAFARVVLLATHEFPSPQPSPRQRGEGANAFSARR
jgi:hypothetical protein